MTQRYLHEEHSNHSIREAFEAAYEDQDTQPDPAEMIETLLHQQSNLMTAKPQPQEITMPNANTKSIEDVINTLEPQYRLSSYLKLRGHISFKAAKLTGMYMAKLAKVIADSDNDDVLTPIDKFNKAVNEVHGATHQELLMDEAGMTMAEDMWDTIKHLVMYANKLNYELQDLADPPTLSAPDGKKRFDKNWKFQGVYFNSEQQRASWISSVALVANADDKIDALTGTYAQYVAALDNTDWAMDETTWIKMQESDSTLYDKFGPHIVELLLDIGVDECDFDELPIRAQIAAIENMKGKVPSIIESAMKSVKFNPTVEKANKVAEGTKLIGIIKGFDQQFCEMLDSARYANFAEFMYSYIPTRKDAEPVTRRMITRNENKLRQAFLLGKRSETEMAPLNDDFLDSDEL